MPIRKLLSDIRLVGALNRQSSDRLVTLAQRALRRPESLSAAEVRSLAASVLSQAKPGPVLQDEGDVL